ncbi:MAG: DUF4402 domain-containing protein [Sphingomonadaceae bacterium]
MRRRVWGPMLLPDASSDPATSRAAALFTTLLPPAQSGTESLFERALRLGLRVAALLALTGIPGMAFAAPGTGQVRVTTVQPLTLVKSSDLDFGSISAGATAGTVRIDASTGARTTTGGATAAGGAPTRAVFVGASTLGLALNVQISPSPTLTRSGGGGSMTTALQVEGGTGWRLFTGTGPHIFRVGGQLNVGANQPRGNYTGQFTLTVTYF